MKNANDRGYFTNDSEIVDKSVPGEYKLRIRTCWFGHNYKLVITDTIASVAKAQTVSMEVGSILLILKDFVIEGEDTKFISDITLDDCKKLEEKTIALKADGIICQSKMHVVDTVPPQVSVHNIEGIH